MSARVLWVCPEGSNNAIGERNATFASLNEALNFTRAEKDEVWKIILTRGKYYQDEPVMLKKGDNHIAIVAEKPGAAEIVGARPVTGWTASEMNGVTVWTKDLGQEYGDFQSLFDEKTTLPRSRFPKEGYFHVAKVDAADAMDYPDPNQLFQKAMYAEPQNVRVFHNMQDVTLKLLHFWKDETVNLTAVDPKTGRLEFSRRMTMTVKERDRFFFDNVLEEMRLPGEWYFDKVIRRLYYVPREQDEIATTVLYAASTCNLLKIDGAEDITFQGVSFQMGDWLIPEKTFYPWGSDHHQAAFDVCGAIEVRNACDIRFDACRFEHLMSTGIRVEANVQGLAIEHCIVQDIGGSGIFVIGENLPKDDARVVRRFLIRDNYIEKYGRRFLNGTGIGVLHACEGKILDNSIHDGYSIAMTLGWVWGYGYSVTSDILVSRNHVWDVGQNTLADMGAIYTLGVKENIVISENIVHDVQANLKYGYGGWGIYMDEGSSNVLVTKNLIYRCNTTNFYQHFGRDNLIINNILAFGDEANASAYRSQSHIGYYLIRNIMVSKNRPFISPKDLKRDAQIMDANNICWDYVEGDRSAEVEEMRAELNLYHCTTFADPQFFDPEHDDFRLKETSPALAMGFVPWKLQAGALTEHELNG